MFEPQVPNYQRSLSPYRLLYLFLLCCLLLTIARESRASEPSADGESLETPAWIELCEGDLRHLMLAAPDREYLRSDGSRRWLRVTEAADPTCIGKAINVPAHAVRWLGLIPAAKADWLGRGVILQGPEANDGFRISEVVVREPASINRRPLPLQAPLLTDLHPRLYGQEERASLSRETGLTLNCATGRLPAGLVLSNEGARLPAAIALDVSLAFRADAAFTIGFADGRRHRLDAPLPLGGLEPASVAVRHPLPPADPTMPTDRGLVAFTLMCPAAGGRLALTELQLQPRTIAEAPDRSVWIWRPAEWLENPDALLGELLALGTRIAYISVPIEDGQVIHAEALADFIGAADALGLEIWAVEGDPHAVLPDGRASFVRRAAALAAFNERQPQARRLQGVQYDIEPYLLPDFALDTEAWLAAYVATIAALDAELDVPLEVAVPFWWAPLQLEGQPFLNALAPHVQGLNVMNYRTDPLLLQHFAEPYLAWGAASNVPVRIALEAGPIQDEVRRHFTAADQSGEPGTLWHLELAGEHVLVLLEGPAAVPDARGFQQTRQSTFTGDRLTFQDDRVRMDQVMGELELLWTAWPSFAGLALHEYRARHSGQPAAAQGE